MGFRFRRSLKLMPGVRLNISRSGFSTSLGGKGATLNIGKRGTRGTVGLPGSGLSYSTLFNSSSRKGGGGGTDVNNSGTGSKGNGCALMGVAGLFLLLIAMCSGQKTPAPPQGVAALGTDGNSKAPTMAYVAARSLNCRASANAESAIIAKLVHNDALMLTDSQQGWSKVQRSGGDCWVATRLVTDTQPGSAAQRLAGSANGRTAAVAGGVAAGTAASYYASGSGRTTSSRHSASQRKAVSSVRKKRSRKAKVRSSRRSSFGGGCPCSGGTVCIGPRGGRYCITRGGNKRYGV
jgi:hypothetical protein